MLASDFYLISHSDTTGRPRVHPRALGLGLAAGLLGELMAAERLSVCSGVLTVWAGERPGDALAHTVLDRIVGEPGHRLVRVWLDFLALSAVEAVGERLARAGVLWRDERRSLLLRRRVAFEPVDMNVAVGPQVRLSRLLSRRDPVTLVDATLVALLAATGLAGQVVWDDEPHSRRYLVEVVDRLPASLRELAAHTEAAVGAGVGAHRT